MKSSSNGAQAVSKGVVSAALSIAAGVMDVSQSNPCLAQESNSNTACTIDWNKLNLSSAQSSQIKQLEQQWFKDSGEIIPQINEDRIKLQRAMAEHDADPVQVLAIQHSVARRREQLQSLAMQNFLAKKKVLNDMQKKQLEDMVRIAVANRKGSQIEVMPDKIQSLMQRVRDIWPVNSDH